MEAGLFRQIIIENNLSHYITELSLSASKTIREEIIKNFMMKIDVRYLWEGFKNITKLVRYFEASDILILLREKSVKEGDRLYVFSDEWRDNIIIKVKMINIEKIIEEALLPSEDLYIGDIPLNWCIALNHHKSLMLCDA